VRPLRPPALIAACALAASGCGNERSKPIDIFTPRSPTGTKAARFAAVGMSFTAPANWELDRRRRPAVFVLTSGRGAVAGWVYRRREPLPRGRRELDQASERLVREAKDRDPRFALAKRRTLRVDGAPAIELVGEQSIRRRRLGTRSVHVFRGRTEYVVEVLAPPKDFARVDSEVMRPLLDSLRLTPRA
jgi:hypothetical protein